MKHNLKTLTIDFTQAELDRVKKELRQMKEICERWGHTEKVVILEEILGK